MVYDNASHQLLLFGGWDPATPTPVYLNDTWTYSWNATNPNASTWIRQLTPSGLSPRFDASFAYDSSSQLVVLFGGESTRGPLNDTWLWDGVNWTEYSGSDSGKLGSPAARVGAALAPSAAPGASFGGANLSVLLVGGDISRGVPSAEVWLFGNAPLSVFPPKIDPNASDVGSTRVLSVVAFGGNSSTYSYNWMGLPPGCTTNDSAELTCTPSGSSSFAFEIFVVVNDSFGASVQSPPSEWTVNPALSVSLFTAAPSPVVVDSTLTFQVLTGGGTNPVTFQYLGLPTGCTSTNSSQLTCSPQTPGTYPVAVTITDSDGEVASASTIVVVSSGPAGHASTLWEVVLGGILFATGFLVAVVLVRRAYRRREQSSQSASAQPPDNPPSSSAPPPAGEGRNQTPPTRTIPPGGGT
jgi:hypothetical protein